MSALAAIDLGTHNCRLLIAEADGAGFRPVLALSRLVRLGEGAAATGRLQPEAMARTLEALKEFSRVMRTHNVEQTRAAVTEAARMADNAAPFLSEVERETGLGFEIFSARDEVRTSVVANVDLMTAPRAAMFDIGGGSTEVALVTNDGKRLVVAGWVSLPIGVVRGRDAMAADEVSESELDAAARAHADAFAPLFQANQTFFEKPLQIIGTSGTMTTLAALCRKLKAYRRETVDGATLDGDALTAMAQEAAQKPLAWRLQSPVIGPGRAEYLIPGCAIFLGLMAHFPEGQLTIGDRGLREGLMREMLGRAPEVAFA
jgi:exopolyphosphatase / guanosine-5'-triphosphate,3'-diphosphate pyrophosphatase